MSCLEYSREKKNETFLQFFAITDTDMSVSRATLNYSHLYVNYSIRATESRHEEEFF